VEECIFEFFEANLEHFSPDEVIDHTSEKQSSPVDEFFGTYSNLTRYEMLPLVTAVKGIRILGQMVLIPRFRTQISALPLEIVSLSDQSKLGSFAAMTLDIESTKFDAMKVEPPLNPFPDCYTVARVHHLTWIHHILEFDDRSRDLRSGMCPFDVIGRI
jgi:hypothetical protein